MHDVPAFSDPCGGGAHGLSERSPHGEPVAIKQHQPPEAVRTATNGHEGWRRCAQTLLLEEKKILALVFSKQLMGMLSKAKGDIEEAMRLLVVSSIRVQVSTRRIMESVSERLDELHEQINANYPGKHEVSDLFRTEMQLHRNGQGTARMQAALSEVLVRSGVFKNAHDLADHLDDLRRDAEGLHKAKAIYDQEILDAVLVLTAADPQELDSNSASLGVQECLLCPISGEIMRDPVTVMESGLTYDRKSLCSSLLTYPKLEPCTGQRFDHPLHYTANIAIRNMVTMHYGDAFFEKYDDSKFKVQYKEKWDEIWRVKQKPSTELVTVSRPETSRSWYAMLPKCCLNRKVIFAVTTLIVVVVVVLVVVLVVPESTPSSSGTPENIIEMFRLSLPVYTSESLQDENSPQHRAYEWVTQFDKVPIRDELGDEDRTLF